jgi:HD-like signal output (HDOD) protein
MDHCQIGQWMAKSWGFSPSLIDVIRHHHDPRGAENDIQLAEIVCAAEYYVSASPALPVSIQIRENIPAALIQSNGAAVA